MNKIINLDRTKTNKIASKMKCFLQTLLLTLFLFAMHLNLNSQIIFQETFSGANGATSGSANGVNWSSSCPTCLSGDWWEIKSGVFEARDTNGEAVWNTDNPIDISNCDFIEISFNIQSVGTMEACGTGCNSADWVRFQYNIDGNGWTNPANSSFCGGSCAGINVVASDDVGSITYTTGCIPANGNGLNLKISAQCWAAAEYWRIDNVTVTCSSPNPGTNGSLNICTSASPTNLFDQLGGNPDNGGTWSGPSNLTGGDLGTFNPATMNPGTYTYTVGNAPCQTSADVVVTTGAANAGNDGNMSINCGPVTDDLFPYLTGNPDTGGTWSGPSAIPSNDPDGNFDPLTMNPGVYTYTVGNAPCQASANVTVTITNNNNAGNDNTIDVCANAANLNLFDVLGGNPDNGGIWSGPSNLTGGDLGTFDPASMNQGTYTYTVGSTPCDVSATITVNIIPLGNPGNSNSIDLCTSSPTLNLFDQLGGNPDNGGTWSGPSNLTGGDLGTFDPATMNSGTYTYTVGNAPCDANATITVNIIPLGNPGSNNSIDLCTSSPTLNLFDQLGGNPYNGGIWSGPSNLTGGDLGTFNPATMNPGVYTYTIGNAPCDVSATVTVNIHPLDDANFTFSNYCENENPIITITGLTGGTFAFNPIPTNGATIDPNTGFITNGIGGTTYTIRYTTNGLCPQSTTQTIDIYSLPNVATNNSNICIGDSIELTANGALTYSWDNNIGTGQNHFVSPTSTTTYTVTGTSSQGCQNSSQSIITVNPLPIINAGADKTICEGSATTLNASGGNLYNWTNGISNGVPFYPNNNSTYIVTGIDLNGCINTDTISVNIESLPAPVFFSHDLIGCVPSNISFYNNTVGNYTNCRWSIDGEVLYGCDSISYIFNNSGSYDITLELESPNGCIGTTTYPNYIYIEENPTAKFSFSEVEITSTDSELSFLNESNNASNYIWFFGDGNQSIETDPVHNYNFSDSLSYTVTLVAISNNGCTDSTQVKITRDESLIYYVPNSFTPDGDEFNNTFTPIFTEGIDFYDYQLFIYNRWGELIFESNDVAFGWDGTGKGSMQMNGTYIWKIDFKLKNSDQHISKTGHVNFLK